MKHFARKTHRTRFHPAYALAVLPALYVCLTQPVHAQKPDDKTSEASQPQFAYRTFYLQHAAHPNEINDLTTALRNMLPPATRVYSIATAATISVRGSQEDVALAERIIGDLDRGRSAYRLVYTVTDMENGQRLGTHHFTLLVASGATSELKQGSRVPIAVGANGASEPPGSGVQYIDVGMNIRASVDGKRLHTIIEQSSVSDEHSGLGTQDPIIRQTLLDVTNQLAQGKPLALGTIDVPNTSRRQEVEVVSEAVQ